MIEALIDMFSLRPLNVEGGLFAQTYVSAERISADHLPERYSSEHPYGTAIYYLLTSDANSFSALHRLPADEVYHFYLGDPVMLLQLYPDGRSEHIILGQDVLNGQRVQYVAPHNVWQGSFLLPGGAFALLGTTMAPGFVHQDYEGGERDNLIALYPHEADLIRRLTRPDSPSQMSLGDGA
ncbi:MAG: cupin domain-containing protein [Chloroflexota bacterium]|nr:cupin domain-containing protein [Chloroflexota bacterium]